MAGGAGLRHGELQGALAALGRLAEGDLHLVLAVLAPPGCRLLAAKPIQFGLHQGILGIAAVAAEEGFKEVAEAAEPGPALAAGALEGSLRLPGPAGLCLLELLPVRPQPIVLGALLRILEHLVGLADALESLGGLGILVDVRMQLPGQLAVGGADLLFGGASRHAQGGVVIAEFHTSKVPPPGMAETAVR
jgi:hypothetical protein